MIDLDQSLDRLANIPVPEGLAMIDDAILASLPVHREDAKLGSRLMGVAGIVALAIGIAGGSFTSGPAVAAQPLSPFAPASALAPSTLLGGSE